MDKQITTSMQCEVGVASYSDGDVDTNRSDNPSLISLIEKRVSRRATILGGGKAAGAAVFGSTMLAACGSDDSPVAAISDASDDGSIVASAGSMITLAPLDGAVAQTAGQPVEFLTAEYAPASFIAPAVAEETEFRFSVRENGARRERRVKVQPARLNFEVVEKNFTDVVTVPRGYSVKVLTALGDPILVGVPAFRNDGTDTNFAGRIGDHGDALYYFGLNEQGQRDDNSSARGILAQNHENLNVQYLHPAGPTTTGGTRPEDEAIKEIEAHGVSFTEIRDEGMASNSGEGRGRRMRDWQYVQGGSLNRRITPNTPTEIYGPVRGSDLVKTKYSPAGTDGRGTINNCANGATSWGTLLTCEENWAGYFLRAGDEQFRTAKELRGLLRYGVRGNPGNYGWATVQATTLPQDLFSKWDARATSDAADGATSDYRNEPNQYGWVVEIDPYDPNSKPRKRTALGRMGHEGAWLGKVTAGRRLAVYMGDDSRNEYFYKYVSDTPWSEEDGRAGNRLAIGDKYLENGTLYVARFDEDGTGRWLPLVFGQVPDLPDYAFADQADVLVHTRLAADAVGATTMDRPEWTASNPVTGEIYLTLTNNRSSSRPIEEVNAANPRFYNDPPSSTYGNPNGHIIRIRENGDDPAAMSFTWDIYLFGADAADREQRGVDRNISRLSRDNDFSSPDGLWFSRSQNVAGQVTPLAWIQTDDGSMDDRGNDMMLAALPGQVGDGETITVMGMDADGKTSMQQTVVGARPTLATLRRFLVGPNECEITGVDSTPDGRTLFVGIQHPGEDGDPSAPSSNWPQSENGDFSGRPRSGVVAITRDNGGIVGL
ncbi:PhoX family protein [Aurantiacibacter poecillastricola]|uniref:PhoX family protein n=1 Tax=Aurantiacibacter poecillastricola TaxID=3064385 RepID=UPI00273DC818|nr:PhoX family phosphatase [Aurantiacibacter sp. 219JJ12-13]MDP5261527.1 PhoX family phosphatase [Aurantiacibacter sp. 219JJ12-13]